MTTQQKKVPKTQPQTAKDICLGDFKRLNKPKDIPMTNRIPKAIISNVYCYYKI